MDLKILSWNIRGANDISKRKIVKALLRSQRLDLFCLQETKIHSMSDGIVRSLGLGRFLEWIAMEPCGIVGGILVVWDKRSLELLDKEVGSLTVSCRFRNVEDGFVWVLFGVYGPLTKEGRTTFWEELGVVRGLWEEPWCIGGCCES